MMKEQKETRQEVMLAGFGGQGIILAGKILGMAASLGDRKESTLVQSYGPESRGGACCAQVIISEDTIRYPYIDNPDILICMSQASFDKFKGGLKPEGRLLIDRDLVQTETTFSIPATRMAEELGRKMMANIIMLGFTTAITGVTSQDAIEEAVKSSVPKGTEKMNITAFQKGYEYGLSRLRGLDKKAQGQTGVIR